MSTRGQLGHAFLAIAENDEVFLIMDEILRRWPTLIAAIEALLSGFANRLRHSTA